MESKPQDLGLIFASDMGVYAEYKDSCTRVTLLWEFSFSERLNFYE